MSPPPRIRQANPLSDLRVSARPGLPTLVNRLRTYDSPAIAERRESGKDLEVWILEQSSHAKGKRIRELEKVLRNLKQPANESRDPATFVGMIGAIRGISERLFPGSVTIDYASDPEDSSHQYLVFDVVVDGEYAAYRDRIFQWYEEVEKLIPGTLDEFRLIVHPKR
jgi:hypothetical protein